MGPIAPKDPVKQRDFYYIMLEKQISAAPAPDGRGVCFLYQDGGRMISSSKIIGNINDQEMLGLLRTAEGFRKLVYGIGVSVMSDLSTPVDFVFQMYGKTDPYVTGTSIKQSVSTDGVEYLIPLNEVNWSDDDKEPGQIRFEFTESGHLANVNVRFYLNDGYHAPKFEGVDKVDITSDGYKAMIAKSLVSVGNASRLLKAHAKAQNGEPITLGFIGGSITQGAGAAPIHLESYAYKMWDGLCKRYGKDMVKLVKAGVGGTPSELGMIRYRRDVLDNGNNIPDIVVVEFAVNDAGDETGGDCFEGLVRKILNGPGQPAVIILFSVFADDYNLEDRLRPIGYHYDLPMVSLKSAVTDQFYLTKSEGRVLAKSTYFYDCYHPTNMGHTIMADSLLYLYDKAVTSEASDICYDDYQPLRSSDFENVELIDKKDNPFNAVICAGGFTETDTQLQCCEMNFDPFGTPQFPHNWMYKNSKDNSPLSMDIDCRVLLIVTKDDSSPAAGCADVYVDGTLVRTINPHDVGWVHCSPLVILRDKVSGRHHIEVRIHEGDEEKYFTVLGFAAVR